MTMSVVFVCGLEEWTREDCVGLARESGEKPRLSYLNVETGERTRTGYVAEGWREDGARVASRWAPCLLDAPYRLEGG